MKYTLKFEVEGSSSGYGIGPIDSYVIPRVGEFIRPYPGQRVEVLSVDYDCTSYEITAYILKVCFVS